MSQNKIPNLSSLFGHIKECTGTSKNFCAREQIGSVRLVFIGNLLNNFFAEAVESVFKSNNNNRTMELLLSVP